MKSPYQSLRDLQHFGEEGGVVPVIDVASTSTFLDPADMGRAFHGELPGCYLYSRHSNPSVKAFGQKLAALEGGEAGLGVASGMAAISAAIDQLVPAGGHIVASRVVYGGTYALFANLLPRRGVTVSFVDMDDLAAVEKAIRPETRVLYTETMSNPLLNVADLAALAKIKAKHRQLSLVVDNTFAPVLVRPLTMGADVVVHSATKYISGASDMICGALVGSREFIDSLIDVNHGSVMLTGPVMDPRIAHELYLRLDHLPVRMKAHGEAALHLARGLQKRKINVIYPGLESHPHHARLRSMGATEWGFGAMMAVDCGNLADTLKLSKRLQEIKFGLYAVSLGFSRTLMSCPSVSTSSEIPEAEQKAMKLEPGLLRLSIGYVGDPEVMLERFLQAWDEVFKK
jgi:methionine-gamma-lyase